MKIQKLHIDSFRHLENVEFDFTYQTGERKGQPLDKICLIGQSATGKTSVLEYINNVFELQSINNTPALKNINGTAEFRINKNMIFKYENNIGYFGTLMTRSISDLNSQLRTLKGNILFYFNSEILSQSNFNIFAKNTLLKNNKSFSKELSSGFIDFDETPFPDKLNIDNLITLQFTHDTNVLIWEYLLSDISKYRKKLTQKGSELINQGLHIDYKKLEKEMEKWKRENPNPLIELSEKCLNPIFKKVNLEVDIVDTSVSIPLKPINKDKPVPANSLSTGTKQLLLTALPLFKLPTDNTMILIDEPERSLYPDMQIELMDYYKNLAPNAQFIVATHSPFIAAAFEPEERFVLYFGEDGKVKVRNGVSPIGDDPNDILYNDFGLSSVINKAGEEAYKIYLAKKQQMIFEEDKAKKKELLKEVEEIGEKYNF